MNATYITRHLNHGRMLKNPFSIKALQEIVNYWMPNVLEFICGHTTNYNDVFHSIQARFFNKNFNNRTSSIARICQNNKWYTWIRNVQKRIKMQLLPLHSLSGIIAIFRGLHQKEEHKMEKIQRKQKRERKNNWKKRNSGTPKTH